MGKKKADAEVDLPYDPKSRSHFVNFEVLKRLSAPRLGGSPDAYKLFDDDAPYDKYIENPPTEDVFHKGPNVGDWGEGAVYDELRRKLPLDYLKKRGIRPAGDDVEAVPWTPPPAPEGYANNFTFGPTTSFQAPWTWQHLGRTFHPTSPPSSRLISASLRMSLAQAASPSPLPSAAASKHLSYTLRRDNLALTLSTNTLALSPAPAPSAPSFSRQLALTFSPEPNTYLSASYDILQRRPQATYAVAGAVAREKAFMVSTFDFKSGTYRVRAAASFPGPEWREQRTDQWGAAYAPPDHGGRHQLWLDQECRWNLSNNRSKIGGALDLGVAANLAAHYWLTALEPGPMAWTTSLWGMLPLGRRLRAAVLPEADPHDLLRYHGLQGLQLEASHTFDSGRLLDGVALAKRLQAPGAGLRAYYNCSRESVGVEATRGGLRLGVERGVGGGKKSGLRLMFGSDGLSFNA